MHQFKKSFTFHDVSYFDKPHVDQSGVGFKTRESTVENTFTANVGDVVVIPSWILESDHFKMAMNDGNIVEVE